MLKPKPVWLQRITPSAAWVTLTPDIYYPSYVLKPELYPDIIAHEEVHIRQQNAMGLSIWLARYLADRHFRMDQECQAASAQIHVDPSTKEWVIKGFEGMLNTATYFYCDISPETIRKTIEGYLSEYHTCAEAPGAKWKKYYASLPPIDEYRSKYYGEWSYPTAPAIQLADVPWCEEDFTYDGYVHYPVSSNNTNRRSNEDGQDQGSEASYNPWYKNPVPMESYLDRY